MILGANDMILNFSLKQNISDSCAANSYERHRDSYKQTVYIRGCSADYPRYSIAFFIMFKSILFALFAAAVSVRAELHVVHFENK